MEGVGSVFVSVDFVNFKLTLRPAGCSNILQKIQGGRLKIWYWGGASNFFYVIKIGD